MLVMGVVNVTPDSFSDGGLWDDAESAIAHALQLVDEGADIVDVGGESTRPGATRPLVTDELGRVIPVIEALAAAGVTVSVDTMRAEVAERAIAAGARIVNDVSGGLADERMLPVVAASEATYVAMHWRAHSHNMADFAVYDAEDGGVVSIVHAELQARVESIEAAGVDRSRLVLDPGLGFAKKPDHDWSLLRGLDVLAGLGLPLLVGASRKSFVGRLLGDRGALRPPTERDDATLAITTWLALQPAPVWGVRVHDVRGTRDALAVVDRLTRPPLVEQRAKRAHSRDQEDRG
ncbi:dihydropteroate synthase [Nocardioides bigeumensis]|jgi:dihydropteroate synthase|uniref:Dihydropteroate synthase n=1 Tax=Nocardioides bigeumensis TaxID=433657 RepID=A0ABP5KFL2_9ACTN